MDKTTALEIGEIANELYNIEQQLESIVSNDYIKISILDYYTGDEKAFLEIQGKHKLLYDLKDKVINDLRTQRDILELRLSKF